MANKTFYLDKTGVNPELSRANEDELVKVYDTIDDLNTDLANVDDEEIIATPQLDYLSVCTSSRVEDKNFNPINSAALINAVDERLNSHYTIGKSYIGFERVVNGASHSPGSRSYNRDYTIEQDGWYSLYNTCNQYYSVSYSGMDYAEIDINGVIIVKGFKAEIAEGTEAAVSLPLHKGDVVTFKGRITFGNADETAAGAWIGVTLIRPLIL